MSDMKTRNFGMNATDFIMTFCIFRIIIILRLKVRSMVGLIPLFAVQTLEENWLDKLPGFKRRTDWFIENRPEMIDDIACLQAEGEEKRRLLSLVNPHRLKRVLRVMLSENEFLSEFGIRALSRVHKTNPYILNFGER